MFQNLSVLIYSSSTNIFIGGLSAKFFKSDNLVASIPYDQDDLTWCIQKATNFPSFLNFFFIAPPIYWVIVIGFIYVTGTMMYIALQYDFEYKERHLRNWCYMVLLVALPATIGTSPRYYPRQGALRFFYFAILLFSVLICAFTGTYLYNNMKVRIPRKQFETVREIRDNDFRLAGSTEVLHAIGNSLLVKKSKSGNQFENANIYSGGFQYAEDKINAFYICEDLDECLKQLLHYDNVDLAVGGSRKHLMNARSYFPSKIFCFDKSESIGSYLVSVFIQRNSQLKTAIDDIIEKLSEGGVFVKWNSDNQRRQRDELSNILSAQMTFEHVSFAFVMIMAIGSIVSTATFICELVVHQQFQRRTRSKIWMYLNQFFCEHRDYLNFEGRRGTE